MAARLVLDPPRLIEHRLQALSAITEAIKLSRSDDDMRGSGPWWWWHPPLARVKRFLVEDKEIETKWKHHRMGVNLSSAVNQSPTAQFVLKSQEDASWVQNASWQSTASISTASIYVSRQRTFFYKGSNKANVLQKPVKRHSEEARLCARSVAYQTQPCLFSVPWFSKTVVIAGLWSTSSWPWTCGWHH